MAHSHPLEGDGVAPNLFYYLWKKGHVEENQLGFKIPDTIVFLNFPIVWYYWNEATQEVKKKGGKDLERPCILSSFNRRFDPTCEIVASFISNTPGHTSTVRFMDAEMLDTFLAGQGHQGILQKFVPPPGYNNQMMQAVWAPKAFVLSKRVNRLPVHDRGKALDDKAITYEGATHYTEEVNCADYLAWKIRNACESFVKHFKSVEHHSSISRMVLYFKEDRNNSNIIWLMFSSCFRISERFAQKRPPLKITPNFKGLGIFSPRSGEADTTRAAQSPASFTAATPIVSLADELEAEIQKAFQIEDALFAGRSGSSVRRRGPPKLPPIEEQEEKKRPKRGPKPRGKTPAWGARTPPVRARPRGRSSSPQRDGARGIAGAQAMSPKSTEDSLNTVVKDDGGAREKRNSMSRRNSKFTSESRRESSCTPMDAAANAVRALVVLRPSYLKYYEIVEKRHLEVLEVFDDAIYACFCELSLSADPRPYYSFTLPHDVSKFIEDRFWGLLESLKIKRLSNFKWDWDTRAAQRKREVERFKSTAVKKAMAEGMWRESKPAPVPRELSYIPVEGVQYMIPRQERSTVKEFNSVLLKAREAAHEMAQQEAADAIDALSFRLTDTRHWELMAFISRPRRRTMSKASSFAFRKLPRNADSEASSPQVEGGPLLGPQDNLPATDSENFDSFDDAQEDSGSETSNSSETRSSSSKGTRSSTSGSSRSTSS